MALALGAVGLSMLLVLGAAWRGSFLWDVFQIGVPFGLVLAQLLSIFVFLFGVSAVVLWYVKDLDLRALLGKAQRVLKEARSVVEIAGGITDELSDTGRDLEELEKRLSTVQDEYPREGGNPVAPSNAGSGRQPGGRS